MLLAWFDARVAKTFGASLATYYKAQVPLEAKDLKDQNFVARTKSALRQMTARVDEFKARERLNVYKKSQLANAFKWTLRDAGYAPAYIDELTDWLVTRL